MQTRAQQQFRAAAAKPPAAAPAPGGPNDPGANFLRALAAGQAPAAPGVDYTSQFQAGLNQARGNIAQQLHGALSDIANSQARAGEALGQYAPMVNNDWQENQAGIRAAQNGLEAYTNAAGVGGTANNGAYGAVRQNGPLGKLVQAEVAPEMAATAATHREDLSDQALLNTGIQQQAQHENALANLAAQQAQGSLDQQALQFQQAQALAAQQNAYAQEAAKQQFGYNTISNQQQADAQRKLYTTQQQTQQNTSPASGIYKDTGLTKAQVDTVHNTPEYKRIAAFIDAHRNDPMALQAVITNLPPNMSAVIGVDFGTELAGIQAGPLSLTSPNIQDNPLYKIGAGTAGNVGTAITQPSSIWRGTKRIGTWLNPFG